MVILPYFGQNCTKCLTETFLKCEIVLRAPGRKYQGVSRRKNLPKSGSSDFLQNTGK